MSPDSVPGGQWHDRHCPPSLDASTGNGLHTFCDRAPCSNVLFTHVRRDVTSGRGRRAVDPVIIVGAGPVGLTLALALARQDVPSVVLDEGPGKDEQRLARTVVLNEDTTALLERLSDTPLSRLGFRWAGWRSMRRKQVMRQVKFGEADFEEPGVPPRDGAKSGRSGNDAVVEGSADLPPLHIAQHVLTTALRDAIAGERLVKIAVESRLDALEQEKSGVTAHTRGPKSTWWRGSYLVGCDGPRSTVRKLQDIRFPGRTAVERHAVAALRAELPWPGEALLHRMPPWRTAGRVPCGRC